MVRIYQNAQTGKDSCVKVPGEDANANLLQDSSLLEDLYFRLEAYQTHAAVKIR